MTDRNDSYPSTRGMTDAEVDARQQASRLATVRPRPLDPADPWDSTRPPRPARLLVTVPSTVTAKPHKWFLINHRLQDERDYGPFGIS